MVNSRSVRKESDKCRRRVEQMSAKSRTNVGEEPDKCRRRVGQMSAKSRTNVGEESNKCRRRVEQMKAKSVGCGVKSKRRCEEDRKSENEREK